MDKIWEETLARISALEQQMKIVDKLLSVRQIPVPVPVPETKPASESDQKAE